jgi:acetyl-CoA carboxylase biotin carboxyl carrier protein
VDIDLEQIRKLLDVVGKTDITEFTIESGSEKITIKKQHTVLAQTIEMPVSMAAHHQPVAAVAATPAAATASAPSKAEESDNGNNGLVPIISPMVGTFYRSPSPTAPAFIDIGDVITPGQTVCIIEAMKLMNDLPSEISGRIVKCCVENGTTVEYGQPLFMVNPKV